MNTTVQKLLDYIRNHGHECNAIHDKDDMLNVKDVWTYRKDDGTLGALEEWAAIEATWGSVRNWLGY